MKKQILNVINFIRAVEPRDPELDLHEPVKRQVEISRKYQLPTTFLLQYDALEDPYYIEILKDEPLFELGIWLEVVQPQVESCGISWRGREGYAWDPHVNVGFLMGYSCEERIILIDALMKKFFDVVGYYPRTAGCWIFDAFTANYLKEKYGIVAMCNCKDQWGTDGYTLYGGYYNQAYYPSIYNSFIPAQTEECQIKVPVFRMLGSDPIHQYDYSANEEGMVAFQGVSTLEPVYPEFGGNPKWVDWFLGEIFNGKCLSFGYTQAGQENSFGWEAMKDGYIYQMEQIDRIRKEKRLEVLTLEEAGMWYQENYAITPASSIVSADQETQETSIWFNNKYYRINLYGKEKGFKIRDIKKFNQHIKETYLKAVCESNATVYESLSVVETNLWSAKGIKAGMYFYLDGEEIEVNGDIETEENGVEGLIIKVPCSKGDLKIQIEEKRVSISNESDAVLSTKLIWNPHMVGCEINALPQKIVYAKEEVSYEVTVEQGKVTSIQKGEIEIVGTNNVVSLLLVE